MHGHMNVKIEWSIHWPVEALWLLHIPPDLTLKIFTFYSQSAFSPGPYNKQWLYPCITVTSGFFLADIELFALRYELNLHV